MATTTAAQDRHVERTTRRLYAFRAIVIPLGPAGAGAVGALYLGAGDQELELERILPTGTPVAIGGWDVAVRNAAARLLAAEREEHTQQAIAELKEAYVAVGVEPTDEATRTALAKLGRPASADAVIAAARREDGEHDLYILDRGERILI